MIKTDKDICLSLSEILKTIIYFQILILTHSD